MDDRDTGVTGKSFFREEALRYQTGRRDFGDVLRLPPAWTRLAFPLILAFVVAAVAYLWFGTVTRYEPGVGVVEQRLIYALVPALERRSGR